MANAQANDTTLNKGPSDSSELQTQHSEIDILLVTVTRVEAQAVLDLVKEKFGREHKRQYIGLETFYDLGVIGGARTFMVRSEMGGGGPSRSTLTVSDSIKELSPSAVIMVGIAFGINPNKQRIGDVLVSKQILDYELQRVGTGTDEKLEIIPRGDRPSASPLLLDRFRDGELSWDDESEVEFGLVLSGNKLVDNLDFREQLRKFELEAIGGEMEGGGLYSAAQRRKVDWIIVKAICDWADGKKSRNKRQRQAKAARNAASFTVHVIEQGGFVEDRSSSFSEFPARHSVRSDQGNLHQVIEYYTQALTIARELGNRQTQTTHLQNLELALLRLAEVEPEQRRSYLSRTAEFLEQAVGVSDALGAEPLQRARVRYHLGRCYHRLGRWREALVSLEQARKTFAQHKARPELARVMLEMGQLYHQSQDFESADVYLKDALRLFQRTGDSDGIAVTQEALGNLALQTARPAEALSLLRQARQGYQALERHERVREVDDLLFMARQANWPQVEKGTTFTESLPKLKELAGGDILIRQEDGALLPSALLPDDESE